MPEHFIRFIPDDPYYRLNAEHINKIKRLDWYENNVTITVNEAVQFADAGENFETVSRPFCGNDLMGWWGDAMDYAYSEENEFDALTIITPCCKKETTLHNLNYSFPQGFYRS